jgi:hypothetical protein
MQQVAAFSEEPEDAFFPPGLADAAIPPFLLLFLKVS